MKKIYSTMMILAMLFLPSQICAKGAAVKVEFSGTSMTIELSQQPKIVNENGNLMLMTNSMSVAITLPCKVTPVVSSDTTIDQVVIRNNDEDGTINVFTLDGKKVATLKDRNELITLRKGMYIINGKKMIIK